MKPDQYKIIRLPQVQSLTALSRSAIYERIAKGTFPSQINLGGRAVGWSELQVCNWIEQRMSGLQQGISELIQKKPAQ
ncbi:AlpA family transcriptional regulator [Cardiobacterium sp. AH-315-I02]|nr:AlpA family transcriptional regulator [Cardiobacterium sp. AH-315-I02]